MTAYVLRGRGRGALAGVGAVERRESLLADLALQTAVVRAVLLDGRVPQGPGRVDAARRGGEAVLAVDTL